GTPLRDAIAARGGALTDTVDGRSVRFYLEGRGADVPSLVGLLGMALAAPDFSAAAIAAARAALTAQIGGNQASGLAVGIQMFRQAYDPGKGGMPALGTVDGLAQLGPDDLTAFYRATYERRAVTASAVGSASPNLGAAVQRLADGLPNGAVVPVSEHSKPISAESTRIVTHRDVAEPWVILGFGAPSPGSPDFGPMLVMESLLGDAFNRRSTTTLSYFEKPIGAVYLYDATPAGMVVYVDGARGDPSLGLRVVLVAARTLAAKKVDASSLARFKTAAEGQFLADSLQLSDRAYLLGTLWSQGLGNDPINAALEAVEHTTPADLQRVAKRYLQHYIVALVLPRDRPTAPGS
ncbi:MAG: insulinase family protein, partial [Candidatus Eremiobacteraeota bacterium]|nr:insulinase family protein [Candidatus Eremiobacteraeota bacterium]